MSFNKVAFKHAPRRLVTSLLMISAIGWTLPASADNSETYNTVGQIASAMGAQGGEHAATYNQIGQIAGALGGGQGAANNTGNSTGGLGQAAQYASALGLGNTTSNNNLTTQPVLYADSELRGMDCLNLELASNRQNRAITQTKNNATDLLATVKESQAQTPSKASAAADLGALLLSQHGGKVGEYAKLYQGMKGDPNATSNALDVEIKSLEKMNAQASDIKIYQKYKNCPGSFTPAPVPVAVKPAPVPAPAVVTSTTKTKTVVKKTKKKKAHK